MLSELLVQGRAITINDVDRDYISQWKWSVGGHGRYIVRNGSRAGGASAQVIWLHRVIMERALGCPIPPGHEVDHIDGYTFNNIRDNLRLATHQENLRNRRGNRRALSKYKGVTWNRDRDRWMAQIKIHGKNNYLGLFVDEQAAARAYDRAALLLFGEFAWLNFPDELEASL